MVEIFYLAIIYYKQLTTFLGLSLKSFGEIVDIQKFYCDFANILFHFFSDMARAHLGFICYGQQSDFFFNLSNELSKTAHPARQLEVTFLHMC